MPVSLESGLGRKLPFPPSEIRFHWTAKVDRELIAQLALGSWSYSLNFPSAEIAGVYHTSKKVTIRTSKYLPPSLDTGAQSPGNHTVEEPTPNSYPLICLHACCGIYTSTHKDRLIKMWSPNKNVRKSPSILRPSFSEVFWFRCFSDFYYYYDYFITAMTVNDTAVACGLFKIALLGKTFSLPKKNFFVLHDPICYKSKPSY